MESGPPHGWFAGSAWHDLWAFYGDFLGAARVSVADAQFIVHMRNDRGATWLLFMELSLFLPRA